MMDAIGSPRAEDEEVARQRVVAEALADHAGEGVEALAHVAWPTMEGVARSMRTEAGSESMAAATRRGCRRRA
jgi:hypothetical protein